MTRRAGLPGFSRTGGSPFTGAQAAAVRGNLLTAGEEVIARDLYTSNAATTQASQVLRLVFFTARRTETITQVRSFTGTTAAAATPTLCRYGVYQVAADGGATLVASTASDTTLFAAANTGYTRSFTVSFAKVAGQRYGLGILVVSAAAMPSYGGAAAILDNAESGRAPVLGATIAAQADLPGSFTAGQLTASGSRFYAVLLP